MSVWIVKELADIHELLEQVEERSLRLSMKMVTGAKRLSEQATTPSAKAAIKDDVREMRDVAADSGVVYEATVKVKKQAAYAVKRAARIISTEED